MSGLLIYVFSFLITIVFCEDQINKPEISGHVPGTVIKTTERVDIDKALTDILGGVSILESRNAAVGLAVHKGKLLNPKTFIDDGVQKNTLPPVIEAGETGLTLFSKYYIGIKGTYGVMTYDIEGTPLMVAVMFSVPFNRLSYSNKYNIKVYPKTVAVNSKLLEQMYKYAGAWKARGYTSREEFGVKVTGTMTNDNHAKIIVWVDAENADLTKPPQRFAKCDYRSLIDGNKCWRECSPIGWCWTLTSCSNDSDCHGNLLCSDKCYDP